MPARTFNSKNITLTVQGLGDFGSNQTSVPIHGITAISGPAFSSDEHDVTDFNSDAMEREPGLPNYGEVSLTLFWNEGSVAQRILRKMGDDEEKRIFNLQVAQEPGFAAASSAAIRGVTVAEAVGNAEAVMTFTGTGFASDFDIRQYSPLAVGTCVVADGVAYVISEHLSATTASVTRLDGTAVAAVTSAVTFKTVRPQVATSFEAYVSSIAPSYGVNARPTIEVGLMVSGKPDVVRTAT